MRSCWCGRGGCRRKRAVNHAANETSEPENCAALASVMVRCSGRMRRQGSGCEGAVRNRAFTPNVCTVDESCTLVGMSSLADRREIWRVRLDQSRVDFFTTEFGRCSTFLKLAATPLQTGNRESANTAIANAEQGYKTLNRYLSDQKHIFRLTPDQRPEFMVELGRLREKLDSTTGLTITRSLNLLLFF